MEQLVKFWPLVKVDEETHMTWGIVTSESVDKDNEICDYPEAKEAYKKWSKDFLDKTIAAGQDPSMGNIRIMHGLQIGGKAIKLEFKDEEKQIWLGTQPATDEVWKLIKGGYITGLSQGGRYLWKKKEGDYTRYCPVISEVSYVDNPALGEASFAYVKSDGSMEIRKFSKELPSDPELVKLLKEAELPSEVGALPTDPQINIDKPVGVSCVCDCAECKADNHGSCMKDGKCALSTAAGSKAVKPFTFGQQKQGNPPIVVNKVSIRKVSKKERIKKIDKFLEEGLINAIQSRAYGLLGKGMYTLSRFSELSESIKYLWLSLEFEEEMEDDNSSATDSVEQCYMTFLDALLAYAEEEVAEAKQEVRDFESRESVQ